MKTNGPRSVLEPAFKSFGQQARHQVINPHAQLGRQKLGFLAVRFILTFVLLLPAVLRAITVCQTSKLTRRSSAPALALTAGWVAGSSSWRRCGRPPGAGEP